MATQTNQTSSMSGVWEVLSRWMSLAVIVLAMLWFANGLAEKLLENHHTEMVKMIDAVQKEEKCK